MVKYKFGIISSFSCVMLATKCFFEENYAMQTVSSLVGLWIYYDVSKELRRIKKEGF